jgi:hypothetical protein
MRRFNIDSESIRFFRDNYGVNVFWYDVIGQRGFRFFLHQFIKGCKLLIQDNPA